MALRDSPTQTPHNHSPDATERTLPYEFDAEQSELMRTLGRPMRDVGLFLGVIGVLSIAYGFVSLFTTPAPWERVFGRSLLALIQGSVFLLLGGWTHAAGRHFERVATTRGADIRHLMEALSELRHAYGFARIVIAAALFLVAMTVILSLIVSTAAGG